MGIFGRLLASLAVAAPDRALAIRQLTILAPASGIEVSAQQTVRSDQKFR